MATATTASSKTPAKRASSKTAAAPKTGHTSARHMRIPDEVWDAGMTNATRDGYTGISELVRDLLRDYNAGKRMR